MQRIKDRKLKWYDNDGILQASKYYDKRQLLSGTTSTLRKAMKAQRIAGTDYLTPEKMKVNS